MRLNDYDLPTDELQVSGDLGINESAMGGSSSNTSTSHEGFEPKLLNVSMLIVFDEAEKAEEIFALGESLEEDGSQTVYDIINSTAQVMGIQKVIFTSKVSIRESSNHQESWRVSFTLKEVDSVAERKAEKLAADAPTESAPAAGAATSSPQVEETKKQLTNTEQVMKQMDTWIAQWKT